MSFAAFFPFVLLVVGGYGMYNKIKLVVLGAPEMALSKGPRKVEQPDRWDTKWARN